MSTDNPPLVRQTKTYADLLKTNVRWDQRLKRNVLEITLEKNDKSGDAWLDLDTESTARLLQVLGIDIKSQVHGCQVKQRILSVWMLDGISLDRFCKEESIKVNKDIRTGRIRPAGKTDVTVTICGLDFNTPDSFVFDYLNKFGQVVKREVIYSKYSEGPLKGKYNGERKYQVDFSKSSLAMGTYHIIDSSKVRVFYMGNKKTCGRCHQFAGTCPGGGMAKECEEKEGPRVILVEHMKKVWDMIQFKPANFELEHLETEADQAERATDGIPIKEAEKFSPIAVKPQPIEKDIQKYEGLLIKNFPKTMMDEDIIAFLKEIGGEDLGEGSEVKFEKNDKNITVSIESLTPGTVQRLIKLVHFPETKQKFFNVPLYCRAIRTLTPAKSTNDGLDIPENSAEQVHAALTSVANDEKAAKKNTDLVKNTALVEKSLLENPKPAEEIKSKLFGNLGEADNTEEDIESEDDFENISQRFEFLKNGEEDEDRNRGQKKRERNKSSPNSGSKHKNKKYKNIKNKDDKI